MKEKKMNDDHNNFFIDVVPDDEKADVEAIRYTLEEEFDEEI